MHQGKILDLNRGGNGDTPIIGERDAKCVCGSEVFTLNEVSKIRFALDQKRGVGKLTFEPLGQGIYCAECRKVWDAKEQTDRENKLVDQSVDGGGKDGQDLVHKTR